MQKSKIITVVLTTLLPCYGYSDDQLNNGSQWLEDNNGINKIILDETDSHGVLDTNKNLIPENNGNQITDDNVIYVTATPSGTNNIYGGYCISYTDRCAVNNTAVVMDGGSSDYTVYGAYSILYDDGSVSANGNVYLNNDAQVSSTMGASASGYPLNNSAVASATGNVYLNDNVNVTGGVNGASANVVANDNASAFATGNVYVNDNAQASMIYGAYAQTSSSVNAVVNVISIGNVYLNNNANVSDSTYGAYANIYTGVDSTVTASATGECVFKR